MSAMTKLAQGLALYDLNLVSQATHVSVWKIEEPDTMLRSQFLRGLTAGLLLGLTVPPAKIAFAAAAQDSGAKPGNENLTPEQRMNRRYPQPVTVGSLIGLPVLDRWDSTCGYIREVVRTPEG